MPGNDLTLLIDAARIAGQIALPYWQQSPETWDKPDGAGPVTEADLAVNTRLQDMLQTARPDYGWLSEESPDDAARLSHDRVFIIDPIDGTRSFIAGEKTWAHSLAIAEHGQIIAGVVFLPVLDRLYQADADGPALLNGQRINVTGRHAIQDATVIAARPNADAKHWKDSAPPVSWHFRPSLAYRMALVAEGRFDAMLTLRPTWEWDVAAGTLIAQQSGALVTDSRGDAPVFNNASPRLSGLLAGTPHIHHALQSELAGHGAGGA